jgi:hypothetical protein
MDNITRMRNMRNTYKILVRKPEQKSYVITLCQSHSLSDPVLFCCTVSSVIGYDSHSKLFTADSRYGSYIYVILLRSKLVSTCRLNSITLTVRQNLQFYDGVLVESFATPFQAFALFLINVFKSKVSCSSFWVPTR